MALPKRKTSKSRSAKRRTHYKIIKPGLSICPNCGELKSPHRICVACGFYKGRTFKKEPEE
ncbi:50S ribosomal protein L32 [Desulfobacterota bacterium AH_259_B03_O07]|nr:50S ribosomal protein L32 [Desulfobacterota bacterium AH_259_B03_O07]